MNKPHPILSRRVLLGGAVSAGLAAAGCSSGSKEQPTGGTIRVAIPSDITPDAVLVFQASNQPLRRTVFDYLIDKSPDGTYHAALASEWAFNKDKTSLVLTLRDDVSFHSGRTFGADDAVASIKAGLDKSNKAQAAKLLARADQVRRSGPHEVTVEFDKPFGGYLDALAMLPMIDPQTFADIGSGKHVVGTGPFTWEEWTPGSRLVLAKNPDYWRHGLPHADQLEFQVIPESQAVLAALRSESIDLANRMVPRDAATLKDDPDYTVGATEGFEVYVGANVARPPMDDVRVRQAIAYGLDRQRIADQVYQGFAEPSCVPWSGRTPGVSEAQIGHYTYDVGRAKSLLAEAGAGGMEIELTSFASDPAYAAIADILQYGLTEIGLTVKPVGYDQATFVQKLQTASFSGLWVAPVALTTMGEVTAVLTAKPLTVGQNSHNVTDAKYGALVDAVIGATSDDAFSTGTTRLTDYLLEQAFHNTVVQAKTPNVCVEGLVGIETDLTLALDMTEAGQA